MNAHTLILFDIDGTLVLTGGAGGRAMADAFRELFGVADGFAGITMAGRTDSWLLAEALRNSGIAPGDPRAARFFETYLRHLARELDAPPPAGAPKRVLTGVRELLDELTTNASHRAHLALLTGNYEPAARLKLEQFDLWRYFRGGAFGDATPDRNELLSRALVSVAAAGGPSVSAERIVIVGDTPFDIAVAKAGGARSMGVATGSHSVEALRAAGADYVFENLGDTAAVLEALRC